MVWVGFDWVGLCTHLGSLFAVWVRSAETEIHFSSDVMAPVSKRQRLNESNVETPALTLVSRTQATPAESPPTLIALNSLKPFTSEFVGNMSNTAQRAFY